MAPKKIPHLKTDADFAKFVEGHDLAPYLKGLELLDKALALAPELAERIRERAKKRLIALRLPQWQIEGARKIARRKRVPYQALMREWIGDGLKHAWQHLGQ
jgi:hypothetical protein